MEKSLAARSYGFSEFPGATSGEKGPWEVMATMGLGIQ